MDDQDPCKSPLQISSSSESLPFRSSWCTLISFHFPSALICLSGCMVSHGSMVSARCYTLKENRLESMNSSTSCQQPLSRGRDFYLALPSVLRFLSGLSLYKSAWFVMSQLLWIPKCDYPVSTGQRCPVGCCFLYNITDPIHEGRALRI